MSEPQLFYKKTWTRFLSVFVWLFYALMLIAILARLVFGLASLNAFMVFGIGILLCVLSVLIGLLVFLWGLIAGKKNIMTDGATTLGLAALPIVVAVLIVGPQNLTAPPIHDITTDVQDPPFFSFASKERTESQNSLEYGGQEVAEIQKAAYPDIQPLVTEMTPEAAFTHSRAVAQELGWEILVDDPTAGMIEAVDMTRIFNFKDDIAIRIQPDDGGSRIDIRSVSRDGQGDFGTNANRVRRFIEKFRTDVSNQ